MRRALKWLTVGLVAYLIAMVAWFGLAHLSISNTSLALIERRLSPAKYVFWRNGEFYLNPPLFKSVMTDTKGQLSETEAENASMVDIWVVLLEGPEEIRDFELNEFLKLDADSISKMDSATTISLKRTSSRARLHILPFYVNRRVVFIADARFLRENYRAECLDEMVYGMMIEQEDQALWDRCKLTA